MKKITILLLLFSLRAFGQVTLTGSYNPQSGNADISVTCDTSGIHQGPAGINQVWNYTALTMGDTTNVHFVSAASTPYASQFTSSNIASTADDSTYFYMTSSQSNLLVNGIAGPEFVLPYSDPQLYMQYPFTYSGIFSDAFSGSYDLGGVLTHRNGTITVTGDAWGTINLPGASFNNALRVKYEIVTRDSSNPGIPVVIVTSTTSYVWFAPGKKFPVFEVIYTDLTFNGTPFGNSKVVNYNISNSPVGIENLSAEIPESYKLSQNYPNPFNPSTTIAFSIPESGNAKLFVHDASGRIMETLVDRQLSAGSYSVLWQPKTYSSGVYFYTLSVNEFHGTRKLILVK